MPVSTGNGTKVWQRRERGRQLMIWGGQFLTVALVVYCWQLVSERTIWEFVSDAPRQALDLGERMVPPKWSYMEALWRPIWDTASIATLGTLMAIAMAFPLAFLAARNTTPSTAFVRPIALFIIVSSRSINSLLWALMLVMIIGPGVLAGVLAIGFRSIGFCAKLLYEAIEEIDQSQVEAITASGASGPQILNYGIVPQILPAFAGISVFRWDINIRESTVLGLVGAGGLGLVFFRQMNTFNFHGVMSVIVAILILILIGEVVSFWSRRAII